MSLMALLTTRRFFHHVIGDTCSAASFEIFVMAMVVVFQKYGVMAVSGISSNGTRKS